MVKDYKVSFKILGQNIKSERLKKGITLHELSQKTGISKNYLVKIEKGEAYEISTLKFVAIALALQVKPYELAEGI